MELIPDWKRSYKFWSVQLGLIGTVVTGFFLAAPEAALYAWAALPQELKSLLPPDILKWAGILILVLSFIARVIRQSKLERETNEARVNRADQNSPETNRQ